MLSPKDNPPRLPPGIETLEEIQGPWWVGHTRSRAEKSFAWDLIEKGIPYYLPLVEKVRYSGRRKRKVLLPLFTGYVFFAGDDEGRYEAMTTNRLCRTIPVDEPELLVHQLIQVERAIAGNGDLDLYPHAVVGKRCRVTSGPFKGMEGVVVERKKRTSVVVLEVTLLGQGAKLTLDASILERT